MYFFFLLLRVKIYIYVFIGSSKCAETRVLTHEWSNFFLLFPSLFLPCSYSRWKGKTTPKPGSPRTSRSLPLMWPLNRRERENRPLPCTPLPFASLKYLNNSLALQNVYSCTVKHYCFYWVLLKAIQSNSKCRLELIFLKISRGSWFIFVELTMDRSAFIDSIDFI